MIGFSPTEDQRLIVDTAAQFAKTTLRPRLREFEKAREVAEDARKTAHGMGLSVIALPESIGGSGLGLTTAVLVEEELAYGDAAAPFGLAGPGSLGLALAELATEAQAAPVIASFSSDDGYARFGAVAWGEPRAHKTRPGLSTIARREGATYVLDGAKAYVTNAERASVFVVFAQVDEGKGWSGTGAFLVPREAEGLSVLPRATTLGLDVASFGGIALEGVVVSEEARLTGGDDYEGALVRFFAKQALLVAARGVGLARAAFEVTRDYVETRKAFGKPIGHFQAVAFTIADRAMDVEAARGLVWRAAAAWDALGKSPEATVNEALMRTGYAVSFAHEAAMRAGDDAVQLHGGAGFMRDYPVEKMMRDAKQLQLCAMTAEQADQLAAAVELGAPLDPGVILPSAESQNAFT